MTGLEVGVITVVAAGTVAVLELAGRLVVVLWRRRGATRTRSGDAAGKDGAGLGRADSGPQTGHTARPVPPAPCSPAELGRERRA